MPTVRLPYLVLLRVKGRLYAYYRRRGRRTRLRGDPGSPAFLAAYQGAHALAEALEAGDSGPRAMVERGSLAWLVARYRASPKFTRLTVETQRDYDRLLAPLLAGYGDLPVASLPRSWVMGRRDALAAMPRKANKLLAVLRRVLGHAIDEELRADNPAARIVPLAGGRGIAYDAGAGGAIGIRFCEVS